MARPRNIVETVVITISTTAAVHAYLEGLAETGLFGKNAAEAAERLVALGIQDQIKQGTIAKKASKG